MTTTYRQKQKDAQNAAANLLGYETMDKLNSALTRPIYTLGAAPTNHAVKLAYVQAVQDLLTAALELPDDNKTCKAVKQIHDDYPAQTRGRKAKK